MTYIMYWYANKHDNHPIGASLFEQEDEEFSMIPEPNVCIPDDAHVEKKQLFSLSHYQYNQ